MKYSSELNGAWEERGVIGTRIEIDYPRITILWRNSPVLETKFKVNESEGCLELVPNENSMKYRNDSKPYAYIKRITCQDCRLKVVKDFPISGESIEIMEKTEQSRYGDYTIADEILDELQGKWKEPGGFFTLKFKGNTLTVNGKSTKIHVLHANWEAPDIYKIADEDPSVYDVLFFGSLTYHHGILTAQIPVYDASPMIMEYRRVE